MAQVHVVPHRDGYAVREAKGPIVSVHESQPEAFLSAHKEAAQKDVPLVDHRENGQIRGWHHR